MVVTSAVVAPVWGDGFLKGFPHFAKNMPDYFLVSWYVLQKTRFMCGYMDIPECDCFFSKLLVLLLMCSFMVCTCSCWNQWRGFHFCTESSTGFLIWWVLPVYHSPSAKPLCWIAAPWKCPEGCGVSSSWAALCLAVISCFFLLRFPKYCFLWEYPLCTNRRKEFFKLLYLVFDIVSNWYWEEIYNLAHLLSQLCLLSVCQDFFLFLFF